MFERAFPCGTPSEEARVSKARIATEMVEEADRPPSDLLVAARRDALEAGDAGAAIEHFHRRASTMRHGFAEGWHGRATANFLARAVWPRPLTTSRETLC